MLRTAHLEARHLVDSLAREISECEDTAKLRQRLAEGVDVVDGLQNKRQRVGGLLRQIRKLELELEAVVSQQLTCNSAFMSKKIREAQDSIGAAKKEVENSARSVGVDRCRDGRKIVPQLRLLILLLTANHPSL